MPLSIRPLRVDSEYAGLLSLWARTGLAHRPRGRDGQAALSAQLGHPNVALFVAVGPDDELVGSVLASHNWRKGWINRLAVDPAHQRQGLARLLVTEAERFLGAAGIEVVACQIETDNEGSYRAFQAMGYVPYPGGIHYLTKRTRPDA